MIVPILTVGVYAIALLVLEHFLNPEGVFCIAGSFGAIVAIAGLLIGCCDTYPQALFLLGMGVANSYLALLCAYSWQPREERQT